jgi:hypothetical protein
MVMAIRWVVLELALSCSLAFPQEAESFFDMWAGETEWAGHTDWEKDRLVACQESDPTSTQNPCHQFVAQALEQVYSVNDFSNGGEYLRPSQITELVSKSADWIEIGPGSDQQTLTTAQERANEGIAVIAVSPLHAALILPGQLIPSESWELEVPNSAGFFPRSPQGSYVGRNLSYAWQETDSVDVKLYYRAR